jgi:hypothetical protein
VRCLHVGADICWCDQISAQISADICRYLADICSKAQLTMQSIVIVVVPSALIVIIVARLSAAALPLHLHPSLHHDLTRPYNQTRRDTLS